MDTEGYVNQNSVSQRFESRLPLGLPRLAEVLYEGERNVG